MPIIYLSPSTQEYNEYVGGGNEEYYMNLIADAMIPYLNASGIQYVRNTPDMTAASSIVQSNAGNFDLHLALHSNAAGEGAAGTVRGSDVYYYTRSYWGRRAAQIIADNLALIYPISGGVRTVPTEALGEVARTKAPAVLIEFAYHDNIEDAQWIRDNIEKIAQNVVMSLTQYFGIPFVMPGTTRTGYVSTQGGNLNIRSKPNTSAPIITKAPNGAQVQIYSQVPGWYVLGYNGVTGYANANYIK